MNSKLITRLIIIIHLFFISCDKDDSIEEVVVDIPKVPEVKTYEVSEINVFSVMMGGKLISQGDSDVSEVGLVLGETTQPTVENNFRKFPLNSDESGEFLLRVAGLPEESTTYHLRAYAINEQGVGYGSNVQFTTLGNKTFVGNVSLTTQEEVVEFGENEFSRIDGGLHIGGSVSDLSPLKDLYTVNNGFSIINTTNLKNLKGLENLTRTGVIFPNGFKIEGNNSLTSFLGLESLETTRGEFYVINNEKLINLEGLDSFYAANSGRLIIKDCPNLINLNGLEKLIFVSLSLQIQSNPKLMEINALKNLKTVNERIIIGGNISLLNIDGLIQVNDIAYISIVGNNQLSNLEGIKKVTNLGSLLIGENLNLRELPEFENISRINSFKLSNNTGLVNLNGFKNIKSFGGLNFTQSNLKNFIGLENLEKIDGNLEISNCKNLKNFLGLENLVSVGNGSYYSGIHISQNHNLSNFSRLQKLANIKGSFNVSQNDRLTSFDGLESLKTIEETFHLSVNKELTSLNGISNLEILNGFSIIENNKLENLPTFYNLLALDYLHINKGSSLLKLDGFVSIKSIGSIHIRDTDIYSLGRFENLERIEDYMEIERCKNLVNFNGLNKVLFANKISLSSNANFKSLEGLESLSEIGDEIDIRGNKTLTSLKGLESLSKVKNKINIYGNSVLSDFCSLQQFFKKEAYGGFYGVDNNLKNPTIEDIINGNCN